jgi:hypothetical protein
MGLRFNQTPDENTGGGVGTGSENNDTSTKSDTGTDTEAETKTATGDNDDRPLGPGGERALAAERAQVKELKAKLAAAQKTTTPEGTADRLAALEAEMSATKAENTALRLAGQHSLTGDDVLLLQTLPVEAMEVWARRLATQGAATGGAVGVPKPDPTQGRGGKPTNSGAADFAARHKKKLNN